MVHSQLHTQLGFNQPPVVRFNPLIRSKTFIPDSSFEPDRVKPRAVHLPTYSTSSQPIISFWAYSSSCSFKLPALGPKKVRYNSTVICTVATTDSYTGGEASTNNVSDDHEQLEKLLESARPFLRGELEAIDENLPALMSLLRAGGARECWHKLGSFLDHLFGVYRILKLWKAPEVVCLCGLFHSAYSNSYADLVIFPPSAPGREIVRKHVGPDAEEMIHLFCTVPRQELIHGLLLFKYTDEELVMHLQSSEASLNEFRDGKNVDERESWREKLNSICPAEGIIVKHIRTGEDILLPRKIVAVFLLMSMADFSDQFYSFQDNLFENSDGRLEFSGNNVATTLWPGDGKPGLWMNSVSRMGAIYTLLGREEEISKSSPNQDLELIIPPVFENCTRVLDANDQITSRDLYWGAVCGAVEVGVDKAEEMLLRGAEKNPFAGDLHVVLAQVYLGQGRFAAAEAAAERGLRLMLEWGSTWDKRMTWHGWVAWGRVLLLKAKEKSWPQSGMGILSIGLVW